MSNQTISIEALKEAYQKQIDAISKRNYELTKENTELRAEVAKKSDKLLRLSDERRHYLDHNDSLQLEVIELMGGDEKIPSIIDSLRIELQDYKESDASRKETVLIDLLGTVGTLVGVYGLGE